MVGTFLRHSVEVILSAIVWFIITYVDVGVKATVCAYSADTTRYDTIRYDTVRICTLLCCIAGPISCGRRFKCDRQQLIPVLIKWATF